MVEGTADSCGCGCGDVSVSVEWAISGRDARSHSANGFVEDVESIAFTFQIQIQMACYLL